MSSLLKRVRPGIVATLHEVEIALNFFIRSAALLQRAAFGRGTTGDSTASLPVGNKSLPFSCVGARPVMPAEGYCQPLGMRVAFWSTGFPS